jgi:hypothetical protein
MAVGLGIYANRECRSVVLTVATVEKPAGLLREKGEVVCYLTFDLKPGYLGRVAPLVRR